MRRAALAALLQARTRGRRAVKWGRAAQQRSQRGGPSCMFSSIALDALTVSHTCGRRRPASALGPMRV